MKKIFRYLRKFTMIVNNIIVTTLLTIVYVCLIIPYSIFMKEKKPGWILRDHTFTSKDRYNMW